MPLPSLPRSVSLALLCAVVVLTRLPFLGAGYGENTDNWRVALAARHIAEKGVYEASRFPGYPIQEVACSWLWKTGPLGLNLLDALFCAAAALFFALICIGYGVRDWWLAGVTLAFVPVLYVNSVSSKDIPWALALLLGSWWCAMRKRPVWTGVLLGLAMGCRITSGAAALPIALILIDGAENWVAISRVFTTGVVSAAIVFAAFVPVYLRYGTEFFSFYAEHAFPEPMDILARMTVEVWGQLGVAALCLALLASIHQMAPWAAQGAARAAISARHLLAWGSMLLIYAIVFLSLPDEASYMIPAIPFALLLAWRITPRWAFRTCCGLMIVSPFLMWSSGSRAAAPGPAAGLIIQDHRERLEKAAQIGGFLHFASMVSGSNAYIAGSWEPQIAVLTADAPPANAKFLYLVTQPELDQLNAEGWRVWYLPLMREFNARVYHYDVAAHGARDVRLLHPDAGR